MRRLLPAVAVLALLLVGAGAALAAVSVSGGGRPADREQGRQRESDVASSEQPSVGPLDEVLMGALVPEDVRGLFEQFRRFEPGLLLDERFQRLIGGEVTFLDGAGQRIALRLAAGSIVRASAASFVLAPNAAGPPQEFSVTAETSVVRSFLPSRADEIEPGQKAYVISREPGNGALFVFVQAVAPTTQ